MNFRDALLEKIESNNKEEKNCEICPGFCCTYTSNSMQITPLEAFEIYQSLGKIDEELREKLLKCIVDFRLDKEIFISRYKSVRRTYTCPFFQHKNVGCSLPFEVKPYGCLAFNPLEKKVSTEGHCASDKASLEKVDEISFCKNEELKKKYQINWEKRPIPLALLDVEKVLSH